MDTPARGTLPPRVLIAEDDDDIRAVIAAGLRCDGYEIIEVTNGIALFNTVRRAMDEGALPDAIVSDIRMPGVTGLRALAGLRRANCRVPVLLVTAHGDDRARQEARRLGVDTFLSKPFDLFELRELVSRLVAHRWR